MGRFGNLMLVNGLPDYKLTINKGDVIRFYITNAANARTFNVSFNGTPIKVVGSDIGKYEKEHTVGSIVIAPGERYIAEVYFEHPGLYNIENINPYKQYTLGIVNVTNKTSDKKTLEEFRKLNSNSDIKKDIDNFRKDFNKTVDYDLELTVKSEMAHNMKHDTLINGIEWEDTMPDMNRMSTTKETKWILRNNNTGLENMDVILNATVGDRIKIRLFNNPDSDHPMQHPIHLHGQRFLVLSTDNKSNDHLVWKDTTLVPSGSTVEILVDVTNPGDWMMHCHISEHLEAGMMLMFKVEERIELGNLTEKIKENILNATIEPILEVDPILELKDSAIKLI